MKRLTGTNKEIAELLYQEQLELSKENRDAVSYTHLYPHAVPDLSLGWSSIHA